MLTTYRTSYCSGTKEEVTNDTLSEAFFAAQEEKIDYVLVPSTTGYSAEMALNKVPDTLALIVVTHSHGYLKNGESEFPETLRSFITESRHKLLTATHAFKGLEGYLQKKYGGISLAQSFADGIRMISPGLKVLIEISVMVCDSGLLGVNNWIVSCGGTHRGLDTSAIIKPTTSHFINQFKFGRLISFPNNKQNGGGKNA